MAARKGVVLGFETMETPFMDTVEKAMEYVKKIDNAYLGIYPDIGNLKNASLLYGTSVNDDLKKGKGHLFAAHLKETVPGKYREIPFGTGHTEFKENIRCCMRWEYTGLWENSGTRVIRTGKKICALPRAF
mgnify:CR=1 FL=1